jgi:hypothetical protein
VGGLLGRFRIGEAKPHSRQSITRASEPEPGLLGLLAVFLGGARLETNADPKQAAVLRWRGRRTIEKLGNGGNKLRGRERLCQKDTVRNA